VALCRPWSRLSVSTGAETRLSVRRRGEDVEKNSANSRMGRSRHGEGWRSRVQRHRLEAGTGGSTSEGGEQCQRVEAGQVLRLIA
jgi:hypothetical protein